MGAEADVALLRVLPGRFSYTDCGRARMEGEGKLECALTLRAGKVVGEVDPRQCSESQLSTLMIGAAPPALPHPSGKRGPLRLSLHALCLPAAQDFEVPLQREH